MPTNLETLIAKLPNCDLWDRNNFCPDYCVLDIESTGVNFSINRINQFGLLLIKGGIGNLDTAVTKYIKTPYLPITWSAIYAGFDNRSRQLLTLLRKANCDLNEVKKAIDSNDGSCQGIEIIPESIRLFREDGGPLRFQTAVDKNRISSKQCEAEGIEREQALMQLAYVIERSQEKGIPIVGHNHLYFDLPFIDAELQMFCGRKLKYDHELMLDLGLIEKSIEVNAAIKKGETAASFYKRMSNRRSRAKWDLDNHCYKKYELSKMGVDNELQHLSAGYDCFVTHCLLRAQYGVK